MSCFLIDPQAAAVAWENYYTEGEVIVRQGEPGDAMFIIVEGEVQVYSEETRKELASVDLATM